MATTGTGASSLKSVQISKGLLYAFFCVYLIIFGFIIMDFTAAFQIQNPGLLPSFFSYIPYVCFIGAVFLILAFIWFFRNSMVQKSRESRSRKSKKGSLYKRALFAIIFVFAFIPLFSPVVDQGKNNHYFSVYNSEWNGCSSYLAAIEAAGFETMSIQSSLSATERLDKSVCLVLLGPNQVYNPMFDIPFFIGFLNSSSQTKKNSLFIAHDHGSSYWLLWEVFLANLASMISAGGNASMFPMTIMADGILHDNASCLTNELGQGDPTFPIITNLEPHPTTVGVSQVILSEATAAAGGKLLIEMFGWDVIGQTSSDNSWVDKNGDHMYRLNNDSTPADDYIDLSFIIEPLEEVTDVDLSMLERFPLGSSIVAPTVFLAKELANTRVFVSSDASCFSNDLLFDYDNYQFGMNIINWLTYQGVDDPNNWVIAFDEAHIRPEYSRDLTSAGIFGLILEYVVQLSTNPITAWIYPLLAVFTLRKYIPKKDEKAEKKRIEEEEKKEEKEMFRTSTFFTQKIDWYKEKGRYGKAITLLFRRIERKLNAQLGGKQITTNNVIDLVVAKEAGGKVNKMKLKRLTKIMDRLLAIKAGKSKVRNPQDFEELFLEMSWAMKNI
ncbi:MAG: hypothetical protein JW891_15305 [Candidatus Lokiarchaeota archaeon]|nr:hypothetical protein [Candidatus Lokiarchaeota archaeon]